MKKESMAYRKYGSYHTRGQAEAPRMTVLDVGEGLCEVMFSEADGMSVIASLWGQNCMSGAKY